MGSSGGGGKRRAPRWAQHQHQRQHAPTMTTVMASGRPRSSDDAPDSTTAPSSSSSPSHPPSNYALPSCSTVPMSADDAETARLVAEVLDKAEVRKRSRETRTKFNALDVRIVKGRPGVFRRLRPLLSLSLSSLTRRHFRPHHQNPQTNDRRSTSASSASSPSSRASAQTPSGPGPGPCSSGPAPAPTTSTCCRGSRPLPPPPPALPIPTPTAGREARLLRLCTGTPRSSMWTSSGRCGPSRAGGARARGRRRGRRCGRSSTLLLPRRRGSSKGGRRRRKTGTQSE